MKIIGYQHVQKRSDGLAGNEEYSKEKPFTVQTVSQQNTTKSEMTLQITVDDAEAAARLARAYEIDLNGPFTNQKEKIYALHTPDRMPVTIRSLT